MLLGVGGLLAALLAAYMRGQQVVVDRNLKQKLKNYKETRGRIDEASDVKRDADASREWLRKRNE